MVVQTSVSQLWPHIQTRLNFFLILKLRPYPSEILIQLVWSELQVVLQGRKNWGPRVLLEDMGWEMLRTDHTPSTSQARRHPSIRPLISIGWDVALGFLIPGLWSVTSSESKLTHELGRIFYPWQVRWDTLSQFWKLSGVWKDRVPSVLGRPLPKQTTEV